MTIVLTILIATKFINMVLWLLLLLLLTLLPLLQHHHYNNDNDTENDDYDEDKQCRESSGLGGMRV